MQKYQLPLIGAVIGLLLYSWLSSPLLFLVWGGSLALFLTNKGGKDLGQFSIGLGAGVTIAFFMLRMLASMKWILLIIVVIAAVMAVNWWLNREKEAS